MDYSLDYLFDDIIIADKNPFKLISINTFKKDGQIKKVHLEELIDLEFSCEDLETGIFETIKNLSQNRKEIKFYPKNIFQRFFVKEITIETKIDEFVICNQKVSDRIKCDNKLIKNIDENILIKFSKTKLFVKQNLDKYNFFFDLQKFEVIKLI